MSKTCKQCGDEFEPFRPMQTVCGPLCASRWVRSEKKREREEVKAKKKAVKPRKKWMEECQQVINKYVRMRDRDLPCCSCDRPASWGGQWHASHYRSVGAASGIRFNLWNIHKGCSICNNHLSGNIAEYSPRIRARIGDEKVDWLCMQNKIIQYDIGYLERLKDVMSRKLKRLEKRLQ